MANLRPQADLSAAVIGQSSNEMTTAATFQRFPNLPTEIRHMIWEIILSPIFGPHLVDLQTTGYESPIRLKVATTRPPTTMLWINHETRAYARDLTKLELTARRKPRIKMDVERKVIFVDLQRDTFRMSPRVVHYWKLKDLSQVRSLEMNWDGDFSTACNILPGPMGVPLTTPKIFALNQRSFLACTGLEKFVFSASIDFLDDAVISTDEPDWAEQIAARATRDSTRWHGAQLTAHRLRHKWDNFLTTRQQLLGTFTKFPEYILPLVVFKFYGPNSPTGFDKD